jgi:hypothetical protein
LDKRKSMFPAPVVYSDEIGFSSITPESEVKSQKEELGKR